MGRQLSSARRPSRPRPEYRKQIEETRRLIRGRRVKAGLPNFGISVSAVIWWKKDDFVEVDWATVVVRPLPDASPTTKRLLARLRREGAVVDALEGDILKALGKNEQFRQLDQRVKAVVSGIARFEQEDPDYRWESDVLVWAEE